MTLVADIGAAAQRARHGWPWQQEAAGTVAPPGDTGRLAKVFCSLAIWARSLLGLFAALALAGCGSSLPSIYYRLTVIVDTSEGRRSGSSVVEFHSNYSPAFPGPEAQGVKSFVRGEATPVKLVDGRYIFAVLRWGQVDGTLPMLVESFADLVPPRSPTSDGDEINRQIMEQIRGLAKLRATRPVNPKHYPALAYFDDLSKPETIHAISAQPGDVIAPGVRLVKMTLEITDGPATQQIRSILPWVDRLDLGYLDPEVRFNSDKQFPTYRYIGVDQFATGRRDNDRAKR